MPGIGVLLYDLWPSDRSLSGHIGKLITAF